MKTRTVKAEELKVGDVMVIVTRVEVIWPDESRRLNINDGWTYRSADEDVEIIDEVTDV